MTLAPRVEVFTQLSCHRVYGIHHHPNPSNGFASMLMPAELPTSRKGALNASSLDSPILGAPTLAPLSTLGLTHHAPEADPVLQLGIVDGGSIFGGDNDDDDTVDPNDSTSDPRNIPSRRCVEDPDVQAGAARLQMIMTTTMGLLSALTTGWWGHFGERHGRTRVLAISTFGLFLTCVSSLDLGFSFKNVNGRLGIWFSSSCQLQLPPFRNMDTNFFSLRL